MKNNRCRAITATTLAAAAATLLTACGSSATPHAGANNVSAAPSVTTPGTPVPAAHAPDPCSLLTDTQASSVLGGAATHHAEDPRDASNGSGVTVTDVTCTYELITSDQLGHNIKITVYGGADRAYFDDKVTHEPVISGLADAAAGNPTDHIFVISKGTVLQIYGSVASADGLQQVAQDAIANL
jgi:hypothetical protein